MTLFNQIVEHYNLLCGPIVRKYNMISIFDTGNECVIKNGFFSAHLIGGQHGDSIQFFLSNDSGDVDKYAWYHVQFVASRPGHAFDVAIDNLFLVNCLSVLDSLFPEVFSGDFGRLVALGLDEVATGEHLYSPYVLQLRPEDPISIKFFDGDLTWIGDFKGRIGNV